MPEIALDIRAASMVVAANNSIHRNMADYVCDGTADNVEIQAAINALTNGGEVYLLDGNYSLAAMVTILPNVHLHLSDRAVIIPSADINIFELQYRARLSGGIIDVSGLGAGGFTNTAVIIQGSQNPGVNVPRLTKGVEDILILGLETAVAWGGTALALNADADNENIAFVHFSNIKIFGNFVYGVRLIASGAVNCFVNGNVFHNLFLGGMQNAVMCTGPSSINGNVFIGPIIEGQNVLLTGFDVTGSYNKIIGANFWDFGAAVPCLRFNAGSIRNFAEGFFGDLVNNVTNNGTENVIIHTTGEIVLQDIKIRRFDAGSISVENLPSTEWRSLRANLMADTFLRYMSTPGRIETRDSDDSYIEIFTRRNTVGLIAVARLFSAVQPRFGHSLPINMRTPTALTIALGVITVGVANPGAWYVVDTEAAAATDDLDTINGGADGDIIVLKAANDARTVVVKHATGNLRLDGLVDFSLDNTLDRITLQYDATAAVWCELSRANNGA